MYLEIDLRKIAFVILIVAASVLGFNYWESTHKKPVRTTLQTFYAMGNDKSLYGTSNWNVKLYGPGSTDFDELFQRTPLTALTNQVHYTEEKIDSTKQPYLEVYRVNANSSNILQQTTTVVLRRWCKDLPFDGEALAQLIAEQVEASGLLPPPNS